MDVLHNLAFGFEHALTLQNLMPCAPGCTVGTLTGLLLPLTYSMTTTGALIVLAWLAPALGAVAFLFGPADYCALMLVGFVCVSFVTTGSLLNGLAMCLIGVLLGHIGTDVNTGLPRFTMDLPFLADGVGLVSLALGCFGLAEISKNLHNRDERSPFNGKIHLIPTWAEFKRIIPSALRGSVLGSILGILPGGGPTIAQFAAYAIDKKPRQPGSFRVAADRRHVAGAGRAVRVLAGGGVGP